MDITDELLKGTSSFVGSYTYDLLQRQLVIELVDNPENLTPIKRITFAGITQFSECDISDDEEACGWDAVMGIDRLADASICLKTDNREIVIKCNSEPLEEILG